MRRVVAFLMLVMAFVGTAPGPAFRCISARVRIWAEKVESELLRFC